MNFRFMMNRNLFSAGHAIDGQIDLKYLTLEHVVAEASEWGIPRSDASALVEELADAIISVAPETEARDEISELPASVAARAAKLLAGNGA